MTFLRFSFVVLSLFVFCFSVSVLSSENRNDEAFSNSYSINKKVDKNIKIAVASNFYHSLKLLLQDYNCGDKSDTLKSSDDKCSFTLSSGSSGVLASQIIHGAPFDVFFSADIRRPLQLEKRNLIASKHTYAYGKLALWFPWNESRVNLLSYTSINIALANEKLAPFGAAAMQWIKKTKVNIHQSSQLVRANNVNQAFQFVDSGNANVGFVAESILIQAFNEFQDDKYKRYELLPTDSYRPIEQQLVILKRSESNWQVQELVKFILSNDTQKKLMGMGYYVP